MNPKRLQAKPKALVWIVNLFPAFLLAEVFLAPASLVSLQWMIWGQGCFLYISDAAIRSTPGESWSSYLISTGSKDEILLTCAEASSRLMRMNYCLRLASSAIRKSVEMPKGLIQFSWPRLLSTAQTLRWIIHLQQRQLSLKFCRNRLGTALQDADNFKLYEVSYPKRRYATVTIRIQNHKLDLTDHVLNNLHKITLNTW